MKTPNIFIILFITFFLSCSKKDSTPTPPPVVRSSEKTIQSFTITQSLNNQLTSDIIGTIQSNSIGIQITANITNTQFIATFTSSNKSKVYIGSTEQISGQTKNDYAQSITYTVKAEDGSSANYTVNLSKTGIDPNNAINNTTSFYTYLQNNLYINLGSVLTVTPFNSGYYPDAYNSRAYGDFDKDGDLDLMAASLNYVTNVGYDVEYYKNNNGTFQKDVSVFNGSIPKYVHGRKAIVGDFDKNGWLDVIIAGHGFDQPPFPGETVKMMLNTSGKFTTKELNLPAGFFHSVCAGDVDNDGDVDVFLTNNFSVGKFMINDGNANFAYDASLFPASLANKNYYTSELFDINKDGYLDLVNTGHEQDGANSIILWGDYTGKFTTNRMTILPKVLKNGVAIDIDFIDYNKDGEMDIVLTRTGDNTANLVFYQGYYIQILQNKNSVFTDVTSTVMPQNTDVNARWINWLRIQDINNDGWSDITSDDKYYGHSWINNNGTFAKQ